MNNVSIDISKDPISKDPISKDPISKDPISKDPISKDQISKDQISPTEKPWFFYIIQNRQFTYAGVSPDPVQRLRKHNGEIKGGAKYTTSKGPGWKHVCIVSGFQNKIQALQFEWAVKHQPPRNVGGIQSRLKKLHEVIAKERWTSKSPLSKDVPLTIEFMNT